MNFSRILEIINIEINKWSKQNLSPIGRIAIIKTLLLSKLNHQLTTLPCNNPDLLSKIQAIFFNYLWEGKPDKISRLTITQPYLKGGLKMVNIRNFVASLKISWLRRFQQNPQAQWVKLLNYTNPKLNYIFFLGDHWILLNLRTFTNPFWKEVVAAYQNLIEQYIPSNETELLCTPLFYNPRFKTEELQLLSVARQGYSFITGFLSCTGNILPIEELNLNLHKPLNWLDYSRIKNVILKIFKDNDLDLVCNLTKPILPVGVKLLVKHKKGSKLFYNILNKSNNEVKSLLRWQAELNTVLPQPTVANI